MTEYSSTNQEKTEPVPPTPAHGSASGSGAATSPTVTPYPSDDAPEAGSQGSAQGVPVPPAKAAAGTSEEAPPVSALAPDAHADGEYDVRTPPTTTF